jgi:hypothetical protein
METAVMRSNEKIWYAEKEKGQLLTIQPVIFYGKKKVTTGNC